MCSTHVSALYIPILILISLSIPNIYHWVMTEAPRAFTPFASSQAVNWEESKKIEKKKTFHPFSKLLDL